MEVQKPITEENLVEEDEQAAQQVVKPNLDLELIKLCRNKACQDKNPHIHIISECEKHLTCAYSKNKTQTLNKDQSDFHHKISQQGEKVIVSDYGLNNWIAQSIRLDINRLPKRRPAHINPDVYDNLKAGFFKDYMQYGGVTKVPEQLIAAQFNKLYEREIALIRDIKQTNEAKKLSKIDPKDRSWMRDPLRLQPVTYSLSKRVSQFQEFEKELIEQNQSNEQFLSKKDQSGKIKHSRTVQGSARHHKMMLSPSTASDELHSGTNSQNQNQFGGAPANIREISRLNSQISLKNFKKTPEASPEATKFLNDRLKSKYIAKHLSRATIVDICKRLRSTVQAPIVPRPVEVKKEVPLTSRSVSKHKSKTPMLRVKVIDFKASFNTARLSSQHTSTNRTKYLHSPINMGDLSNQHLNKTIQTIGAFKSTLSPKQLVNIYQNARNSSFNTSTKVKSQNKADNDYLKSLNETKVFSETAAASRNSVSQTVKTRPKATINQSNLSTIDRSKFYTPFNSPLNESVAQKLAAQNINPQQPIVDGTETLKFSQKIETIRSTKDQVQEIKQLNKRTKESQPRKREFHVQQDELNYDLVEPTQTFNPELQIQLKLIVASQSRTEETNIFKNAEFWMSKGYMLQQIGHGVKASQDSNANQDCHTVALDYYLSGLKINPSHLGCIYNTACCHYFTKKYANAEKWFSLAIKADPTYIDSYIGRVVSCLKLGKYEDANETVSVVHKFEEWTSTSYTKVQMFFIYAICAKITQRVELGCGLYRNLKEGIRLTMNKKMAAKICSLLLIPLEVSRTKYVNRITDFIKLLNLTNQNESVDQKVALNLRDIQALYDKERKISFLAQFIHTFPVLKRISYEEIRNLIKTEKIDVIQLVKDDIIEVSLPRASKVHIVLNGKVMLREHNMNDPLEFNIIQVATKGHIIGAAQLDMGKSCAPNVWSVVLSRVAHFVKMSAETFDRILKLSLDRNSLILKEQLSQSPLFDSLSYQTQLMCIQERAQVQTFIPGSILLKQSVESTWNFNNNQEYRLYSPLVTNLLADAEKSKKTKKDEKQTGLPTDESQKVIQQAVPARQGASIYTTFVEKVYKTEGGNQKKVFEENRRLQLFKNLQARRERGGDDAEQSEKLEIEKQLTSGFNQDKIYVILRGKADVVLSIKNKEEQVIFTLRTGDSFGYSQLLQVFGPEFFGEIRASLDHETIQCFVIDKPQEIFSLLEVELLNTQLKERYTSLLQIVLQRNPDLPKNLTY